MDWIGDALRKPQARSGERTCTQKTMFNDNIISLQPRFDGEAAQAKPRIDNVDLSEDGIALAFAERYRDSARNCHSTGSWYRFTGTHWRCDKLKGAFASARDLCRELNQGNDARLKKIAFPAAIERAAQSDQQLAVTAEVWDTDPFLLGTPGGVVDLRTAELRTAHADDYITKQTAVAPGVGAKPELWLRFLDEATRGDSHLVRFLQQIAGYALTGDIREHALFFVHGPGGNGKGVFVHTLKGILGDYAAVAPMDIFIEARGERHPTELAMLRGARLVVSEESEVGKRWNASRVKQLTGGDPVTARFMRQDFSPCFQPGSYCWWGTINRPFTASMPLWFVDSTSFHSSISH
jgi:putative DNA primase/helicase